jgi:hypothetical protein
MQFWFASGVYATVVLAVKRKGRRSGGLIVSFPKSIQPELLIRNHDLFFFFMTEAAPRCTSGVRCRVFVARVHWGASSLHECMVRYKEAMQPTKNDACLPHLRLRDCARWAQRLQN